LGISPLLDPSIVVSVMVVSEVRESDAKVPVGDEETVEVNEPALFTLPASVAPVAPAAAGGVVCANAACEATTSAAKTEMCVIFMETKGEASASSERAQFVSKRVPLQEPRAKLGGVARE